MRVRSVAAVAALAVAVALCAGSAARAHAVGEYYVDSPSGARLYTKVFLPPMLPPGKCSAVLIRTPYGFDRTGLIAYLFVPFGFAAVIQEMSGTFDSTGNFTVWHDAEDAVAAFQWIRDQSWSNGLVFTAGASADGLAQFSEALAQPPSLEAQFIIFAASDGYRVLSPGGTLRHELTEHWLHGTVPDQADALLALVHENEMPSPYWNALNFTGRFDLVNFPSTHWAGWYDIFQQGHIDGFRGYQKFSAPQVRGQSHMVMDPLGHCFKQDNDYPASRTLLPIALAVAKFQEAERRALARTSASQLDASRMPASLSPERAHQLLAPRLDRLQSAVDAHRAAAGGSPAALRGASMWDKIKALVEDVGEVLVGLFVDFLRGTRGLNDMNAVTFYVMGPPGAAAGSNDPDGDVVGNYWASLPDWPDHTPTRWFLAPDGRLVQEAGQAGAAAAVTFAADPSNPVPTVGGNNLFGACGAHDQRQVEARDDVLVFTSEPLDRPVALVGPLSAHLRVSANTTDADFMVKLSDVFPDGSSMNLADGALRMRWRGVDPPGRHDSPGYQPATAKAQPQWMVPGQQYQVDVDLWSTATVFNKGHRIRVAVAGSNYPRFTLNLDNGQLLSQGGTPQVAASTVYLGGAADGVDAATLSHISLPVVDLASIPRNATIHGFFASEPLSQIARSVAASIVHVPK